MKICLEKGKSTLTLDLPREKVAGVLEGKDVPCLGHDTAAGIIRNGILAHAPAGLCKKSVAVIIPDDTRLWARGDIFVPVIINALTEAGADPGRITLIIALGTHPPIPPAEFALLCGRSTPDRVRVVNSAGLDPGRLVSMGTTPAGTPLSITREAVEADHIVIFGGILHHMLAGYGGGRKYILPGIAGNDAIQANHSLAMDRKGHPHPRVSQGVCLDNPVSKDMQAGADLFLKGKTCTYAAVAANGQGEIFYADAGNMDLIFKQGCRAVDRACSLDVDRKGDFVLFSAGGHRCDTQLYQATKALFNGVNVAKHGAALVFAAGCSKGVGNDDFTHALKEYRNRPGDLGRSLMKKFHMPAYVAFRVIQILNTHKVFLVSDLDEKTTRSLGFRYAKDPAKLARTLAGRGYVIPFGENILPRVRPEKP